MRNAEILTSFLDKSYLLRFKGYNILKRHNLLIKIYNTRLQPLGENASLTPEGSTPLIGAGWEFFNPER